MAVLNQEITDRYAIFNGDCIETMASLPEGKIDFSIYSPPFAGPHGGALYHYSSSDRDLSNCDSYGKFFEHYAFVVKELHRLTKPGRISAVHCADIPSGNSGGADYMLDFPGDIIRLHEQNGWRYCGRRAVWKEPLGVRNRTMAKNLAHQTIVEDSTLSGIASADWLLIFRRSGENQIPVAHPTGLHSYAGSRQMPTELLQYRGWTGKQTGNRFSHWIWRQYASSFWDDIRLERVLPYREARDEEDEKHVHPLQLDIIERAVVLFSNPGETVLTPFAGVGSEVCGALMNNRKAIGVELKPSYFRQMQKNIAEVLKNGWSDPDPNQELDFGELEESEAVI